MYETPSPLPSPLSIVVARELERRIQAKPLGREFLDFHVEGLTLRELAERVEMTIPMLYYRFRLIRQEIRRKCS